MTYHYHYASKEAVTPVTLFTWAADKDFALQQKIAFFLTPVQEKATALELALEELEKALSNLDCKAFEAEQRFHYLPPHVLDAEKGFVTQARFHVKQALRKFRYTYLRISAEKFLRSFV